MDAVKLAGVKAKLFDEFLPLGVDASVIELIIDELDGNEEKCRHHLDSMASAPRTLRNSPPEPSAGAGDTRSGNGSGPPVSQPAPAGRPGSPRMQRGSALSARQDGPPASHRGTAGAGYSGAAARGAPAARPAPARPRLPPVAASSDCSTPLQQKLAAGVPLLVLMRGLPGSGKSTLARQMAGQQGMVVSADDFFTEHGRYVFRPDRLPDAHEWCRKQVRRALRRGQSPVIVDNTNTEAWEMTPYVDLAVQLDYFVEIAEPTTPWRHDPKLLSRRSVHSVPERSIEGMLDRFQGSDRVNVVSLHRMIGKQPKPWPRVEPTVVAATGNVAPSDTPAVEAASAGAQVAPTAAPAPLPSSDPQGVITMADMAAALDQSWAEVGAAATRRLWSAPALGPAAAAAPAPAPAPVTREAGAQTGGGMAGRAVSPRPWQGAPDGETGPPPLTVPLHRGTKTSPPPGDEDAKLQSLSDLFPTVGKPDLLHILEQCDGDLQWATNVLLDTNLESAAATAPPEPAVVAADPAPPPSSGQGGARPKEPPQLARQSSEDSGPDVIVEDLTDSEADRPVVAAADSSGQSTPSIVGEPVGELALQLPARLAYQLQELFGPTAFGARTEAQLAQLPASELTVRLPLDVARRLHYCWTSGADRALQEEQRSFDQLRAQLEVLQRREEEARQALLRNDEEIARQLQMEENGQRAAAAASATSPTPQLRQIMAEQQASQHTERTQSEAGPSTQADRMTRQRLQEEFPGVDPPYLNELLDMHDGDYRQVLRVLQGTRGERPRQTAVIRAPSPPPPAATGGALGGSFSGGPTGDFLTEDGMPSFHDIRAESELVRQKIAHAKTMAERAIRRGDYSVSQYYVDERDRLYKLLNECNVRATIVTMELQQDSDPNRLDLHHLLVEDAKEQLASFIADRQNYFGGNGIRSKTVEIITGKGKNSKHRKPKIKPAVEQWLQNKGFQFREADGNSGMLIVTVHSEHLYRPQI